MVFLIALLVLCVNFVLLRYIKAPGVLYHLTIGFLPFFLALALEGPEALLFLLVGIFYLVLKMGNFRVFQRHEWLATSTLGVLMFFAMYSVLCYLKDVFSMFIVMELIFLLGLMLISTGKGSDKGLEVYFIPNLIAGIIAGCSVVFLIWVGNGNTLDIVHDVFHLIDVSEITAFFAHTVFLIFILCLCFKVYVFPGNYLVPQFYSILTTAQAVVFSTVFLLPYIRIVTIFLCALPLSYKYFIYVLATLTIIWCVHCLSRETKLKSFIGILTVFTQSILIFIVTSGPSYFTYYHVYLCLLFMFFYFLSIMPFLYLTSRSDSETLLDVRLEVFLMNTFKSYIFYLSWLALAGIPLTFLYVTKIATITHLLGHVSAGIALWIYLVMSFYIYVVLFLFLILSKEIYVLHKKDLKNTKANKEQPWVRRVVGIFPWVLLIVLYFLFLFVAFCFV